MPMSGIQPIEYYYPNGFGEINLVDQDESKLTTIGEIQWLTPAILNKSYNETSPSRPIYENQEVVAPPNPSESACSIILRIRAAYVSYSGTPPTTGGGIKYALVGGNTSFGLTLNIDTGYFFGRISDMDDIFPNELGINESGADQTNYAERGSTSLYKAGFGITKPIVFIARAFDSSNPNRYIDGQFTIDTLNNWSSDRDRFILNIKNQMFVDGKTVTNREYLNTMKDRGYFPDCS